MGANNLIAWLLEKGYDVVCFSKNHTIAIRRRQRESL